MTWVAIHLLLLNPIQNMLYVWQSSDMLVNDRFWNFLWRNVGVIHAVRGSEVIVDYELLVGLVQDVEVILVWLCVIEAQAPKYWMFKFGRVIPVFWTWVFDVTVVRTASLVLVVLGCTWAHAVDTRFCFVNGLSAGSALHCAFVLGVTQLHNFVRLRKHRICNHRTVTRAISHIWKSLLNQ